MSKISEGDAAMLIYFHHDKGDITRWCDWDEFAKKHPEFQRAFDRMEDARRDFENLIKTVEVEDE